MNGETLEPAFHPASGHEASADGLSSGVDLVREAFRYQSRFDGSTMVFKIDFPVTEDPAFSFLVRDLALLARTGFRVVIVPGAKEWIDSVLGEYGIVSHYMGNTRITASDAMPFVEMAAFHVATRFMTGISAGRTDVVIGNFVRARGLGVVDGTDMERTGTVDKIFSGSINTVLSQGMIPILPCIGWSPAGKSYNVPSDEIALAASTALKAIKLFVISAHEGLREGPFVFPPGFETARGGRVRRLTPREAEDILALNGKGKGGQEKNAAGEKSASLRKVLGELSLALRACRAGVDRVHLVDGREEGAVLRELFSNLGAGTMIYTDEYEAIRDLRSADIPDMLRMMEPLMQQGVLVRRRAEDIQEKRGDYVVFDIDGKIHACGALHDRGEGQGEIAALATDPSCTDTGLGKKIVGYLVDRAKKKGMKRVFVLTIRAHDWFEALGFRESALESLPEERSRSYDRNRKSKIFALELH
ncbi:MAG: amino-acid N-acetyltransferase [Treponema sp.]|jgi:amino-acid N-acetyltransferase|nr:amino-acid N-acetyltransferase [Treponema sp.]